MQMMERLGYYNGNYGPLEQMMIPMNDRVSWFGDGVYDAGPCRNYRIFALNEHVDRFFRSADKLKIVMPVTKDELKALLNDLVGHPRNRRPQARFYRRCGKSLDHA